MFSRILSATLAAAAILAATPAIANEPAKDADAQKAPQSRERVAMRARASRGDDGATTKQVAPASDEKNQQIAVTTSARPIFTDQG